MQYLLKEIKILNNIKKKNRDRNSKQYDKRFTSLVYKEYEQKKK